MFSKRPKAAIQIRLEDFGFENTKMAKLKMPVAAVRVNASAGKITQAYMYNFPRVLFACGFRRSLVDIYLRFQVNYPCICLRHYYNVGKDIYVL